MSDERALKIGDRIRDNDPRMPGRVLVVKAFGGNVVAGAKAPFVVASLRGPHDQTGETRINRNRIHMDGKPRRSGWSLVAVEPGSAT
jgi:hypothetical protein